MLAYGGQKNNLQSSRNLGCMQWYPARKLALILSLVNCCSYGRHCDMQYVDLGECWSYLTEPGFSWHKNSLNELPIWGEVVWHRDYNSPRIDWWQRFIMIIQILHLESTCASENSRSLRDNVIPPFPKVPRSTIGYHFNLLSMKKQLHESTRWTI